MARKDGRKIRSRILSIRNMINGKAKDGKKLEIATNLRYLRYYLTLYYAMYSSVHTPYAKIKDGRLFYNFYKLKQIAKFLELDIDRTRSCKKIFEIFFHVENYFINLKC